MNINNHYTGWYKPFLWAACDFLFSEANGHGSPFDLRHQLLILPSRRAARRLLELLAVKAKEDGEVLLPPAMLLIHELCTPQCNGKKLTPSQRALIWNIVIQNHQDIAYSFYRGGSDGQIEPEFNPEAIMTLGEYLDNLRTQLGEHMLHPTDISEHPALSETDSSRSRWEAVNMLIEKFNEHVRTQNLYDEFSESGETLPAFIHSEQYISCSRIFLLGCHRITPLQKHGLVKCQEKEISALIFSPEEHSEGFDEYGAIKCAYWKNHAIENLPHTSMQFPESSLDIPQAVLHDISRIRAQNIPEDFVSIGVLENELIAPLSLHLEEHAYQVLAPGTRRLSGSYTGTWIMRLCEVWSGRDASIMEFLQHPLSTSLLIRALQNDEHTVENPAAQIHYLPSDLDELTQRTLQHSLDPLERLLEQQRNRLQVVRNTLSRLGIKPRDQLLAISEFSEKILELLLMILDHPLSEKTAHVAPLPAEHELPEINDIILILEDLREFSTCSSAKIPASDFFQLIKDSFYRKELPPLQEKGIELLGWYELHLDDAPCKLITGCNEEILPEKIQPEPLLPQGHRSLLGLETNDDLYARNNYQMACITHSTACISFYAPKKNSVNERLKLSRLLIPFGTPHAREILKKFYAVSPTSDKKNTIQRELPFSFIPPSGAFSRFPLPHISASAIKTWLRCPYEFYLRYMCGIQSLDHFPKEIPLHMQGTILHDCCKIITEHTRNKVPSDPASLYTFAHKLLEKEILERLGNRLSISMKIQVDNLKRKLELFCRWHCQTGTEGWTNLRCEHPLPDLSHITLSNGENIPFRGRIDRIDCSPDSKTLRIIDIKTSDTPYLFRNCLKSDLWVDPQLPLYGTFIGQYPETVSREFGAPLKISLVLLNLHGDSDAKEDFLDLDENISQASMETATYVAEQILNSIFWPPSSLHASFHEKIFGGSLAPESLDDIEGYEVNK